MADFTLSAHAVVRMIEMGLTAPDIEKLLTEPDKRYEQLDSYGAGRFCYQRGGLALATDERDGRKFVTTVLYNRAYRWDRQAEVAKS